MTNKELAEEIRSIITYLCGVSGKQDKYALECCDELDKKLEVLDIIKKWSFLDTFYKEDTNMTYDRFVCHIHTKGMKEDYQKIKKWLKEEQ